MSFWCVLVGPLDHSSPPDHFLLGNVSTKGKVCMGSPALGLHGVCAGMGRGRGVTHRNCDSCLSH